jgi:hypothetical protein
MSQCPKCDAASLKMSHTHECVSPLRLRSHPASSTHPSTHQHHPRTPFFLGDGTFCCCESHPRRISRNPPTPSCTSLSLFLLLLNVSSHPLHKLWSHFYCAPARQGAEGEDFPPVPVGIIISHHPPPVWRKHHPLRPICLCAPLSLAPCASDSDSAPTSNSLDAFYGGETNKAMTTPFFRTRAKSPKKK